MASSSSSSSSKAYSMAIASKSGSRHAKKKKTQEHVDSSYDVATSSFQGGTKNNNNNAANTQYPSTQSYEYAHYHQHYHHRYPPHPSSYNDYHYQMNGYPPTPYHNYYYYNNNYINNEEQQRQSPRSDCESPEPRHQQQQHPWYFTHHPWQYLPHPPSTYCQPQPETATTPEHQTQPKKCSKESITSPKMPEQKDSQVESKKEDTKEESSNDSATEKETSIPENKNMSKEKKEQEKDSKEQPSPPESKGDVKSKTTTTSNTCKKHSRNDTEGNDEDPCRKRKRLDSDADTGKQEPSTDSPENCNQKQESLEKTNKSLTPSKNNKVKDKDNNKEQTQEPNLVIDSEQQPQEQQEQEPLKQQQQIPTLIPMAPTPVQEDGNNQQNNTACNNTNNRDNINDDGRIPIRLNPKELSWLGLLYSRPADDNDKVNIDRWLSNVMQASSVASSKQVSNPTNCNATTTKDSSTPSQPTAKEDNKIENNDSNNAATNKQDSAVCQQNQKKKKNINNHAVSNEHDSVPNDKDNDMTQATVVSNVAALGNENAPAETKAKEQDVVDESDNGCKRRPTANNLPIVASNADVMSHHPSSNHDADTDVSLSEAEMEEDYDNVGRVTVRAQRPELFNGAFMLQNHRLEQHARLAQLEEGQGIVIEVHEPQPRCIIFNASGR